MVDGKSTSADASGTTGVDEPLMVFVKRKKMKDDGSGLEPVVDELIRGSGYVGQTDVLVAGKDLGFLCLLVIYNLLS